MPTPLEFMERVLPWPGPEGSGWGNLHWSLTKPGPDGKPRKHWRGQPYKTASALIDYAQKLTMAPPEKCEDLYYCTSIQSTTDTVTMPDGRSFAVASRHADTATLIKALFIDVDIKAPPKGYTDLTEALDAIDTFCTKASLPGPSALVLSGGGVHVYWISSRALSITEWRPFAEGLKAEAMRLGLRADYGVTADPARILRVPGTFNRKIVGQPRPVKVLGLGCDYDFATDLAGLAAIGAPLVTAKVTSAPFDLSAFQGYTVDPALAASLANATDKLSDGISRYNDLPLAPDNVIRECPHFQDAAVNRGKGHPQGLWMLTVLASTWFEDGYNWAKRFSDKYAGYDQTEAELLDMWTLKMDGRAKGLGWPSCKSFEDNGCTLCKTCKYRPLNKSPLNLAERVKPPEPEPEQMVVTNPVTQVALTAEDFKLPRNYILFQGQICRKGELDPDDPLAGPSAPIPVFVGEVISKPQISNHIPPNLFFKYRQGLNYMEINLPTSALTTDQTLAAAFNGVGMLINPDADKFVRNFMRSWVARIELATKRLNTAPLGWIVENGIHTGFAYGGRIFNKDGTEEDSGLSGEWYQKFMPSGDEEPMLDALAVVSEQNNPALEVLCLQSWASPLVDIAGLNTTAIVWGWSDGSGYSKSTALRAGMALWGAPVKCRDRGGATAIGMENKMDRLRNLPAQIDELKDNKRIDEVAAIFERLGEGGQGAKGTRGGGLRADKFWQLVLTVGSNKSLYEYQASKGQVTDAAAMRGFEVRVDQKIQPGRSMTEVDQLIGSLEYNYGHLGLRYAKFLAMNRVALDAMYKKVDEATIRDLTPQGADRAGLPYEERFWKTTVTLTMMAAEIANTVTGKSFFHPDAIRKYLYAMYHEHRAWVAKHIKIAGTAFSTEEIWNKLQGEWINNQLVTDTMHSGGRGRASTAVRMIQQPPPDRGYSTHIHWLQNPPMLRIAYTAFVDKLTEMGPGTGGADALQKLYGGKVERKVFLAGIPIKETKAKINVWEIPITDGHPLYGQWADKVQIPEPANAASAAATAQDTGLMAGIIAQGAKDMAVVGATGTAGAV